YLVDKKGEEPKRYDYFEETFLTMCESESENEIWRIGSERIRRRDNDVDAPRGRGEEEDERKESDDFDRGSHDDAWPAEGEFQVEEKFYDARVTESRFSVHEEEIPKKYPQSSSSAIAETEERFRVDPRAPL
ncbi:hypothetical protein Dimus_008010, partial [Dionaea muscipula]